MRIFILSIFVFIFSSCAAVDKEKAPLVLKPAGFNDLPGWARDDHGQVLAAFSKSCERILKRDPSDQFGPDEVGGTYGDWQPACMALAGTSPAYAREFFERWFTPWKATMDGREDEGLFTGYYEASLKGAREKTGPYAFPLHARPDDLVMVDLGTFRDDLKGRRIAGRVKGGHLKPYEDRQNISQGRWPHNDEALVWVDDPVEAFFLHIQGSGRVLLEDGGFIRVGYAGQNGHPYYAIGRDLVHRGALEKEEVSLQSIRAWLENNPQEAQAVMNTNKSYVFFQELTGDGPLGGEGLALTPGRSLAVDRSKLPYGVPMWLDIEAPVTGEPDIRRLVVAQDTGGAIRGAVRGDMFWGFGARAEYLAGHMKSQGRYWLLLPKTLGN